MNISNIKQFIRNNGHYFSSVREFKKKTVGLFFLSLVTTYMYLPAPLVVKSLIDNLYRHDFTKNALLGYSLALLGLFLLSALLAYITAIYNIKLRREFYASLKQKIYSRVLNADYLSVSTMSETDIQARATRDVETANYLTPFGITSFCIEIIRLITLVCVLIYTNIYLSLLLTVMIPLSYFTFKMLSSPLYTLSRATHESFSDYNSKMLEAFLTIKECQIDSSFDYHSKRVQQSIDQSEDANMKFAITNRKIKSLMGIIPLLVTVIVWLVGGSYVIDSDMTVGDIFLYMIYLTMFYGPISFLFQFMANVHLDISAIERLEKVYDLRQLSKSNNKVVGEELSEITFENISMSFGDNKVLKSCNFTFKKGDKVCLVGPNGSGKSTLINILLGLVSPDNGKVKVNSTDIAFYDNASYRNLFGYVPQDIFIYNDSLINNITLERRYSQEKLEQVLTIVGLNEFCQGIDTKNDLLVEKELSGGTKQKIGLARALIKSPKVLVMDEPTNHLDAATIDDVKNLIKQSQGFSVFYISHEKQLQELADLQAFLDKGTISYE